MNNKKVYAGRTNEHLILKYQDGGERKERDHHYLITENPHKICFYLKLHFPNNEVGFESFEDTDKGIARLEESKLKELVEAWECLK